MKGGRCPPCSALTLLSVYAIILMTVSQTFSRLHHCVSVPFHLHALFPKFKRENVGKKGVGGGNKILASMGWYVALSFWILLSTLDRQLNKKTHRLPMCLHRSWKQWESWKAEHAKPWSAVWGWVHRIYTGPQARMGKRLCTPRTSNCGVRGYTNSTSPPILTNGFDLLLSPVQSQLWIGKQGVTWLIPSHARWYIRSLVAHLCACVCTRM